MYRQAIVLLCGSFVTFVKRHQVEKALNVKYCYAQNRGKKSKTEKL